MDTSLWNLIKDYISWLWVPLGAAATYVFKDYNAQKEKSVELEHRIVVLEIQTAGIKEDLAEIKEGVATLVTHLLEKGN